MQTYLYNLRKILIWVGLRMSSQALKFGFMARQCCNRSKLLLLAQSSPQGQTRGNNRGVYLGADVWNDPDFSDKIMVVKGRFHVFRHKWLKSPELCLPPGGRLLKGL